MLNLFPNFMGQTTGSQIESVDKYIIAESIVVQIEEQELNVQLEQETVDIEIMLDD